MTEEQRVEGEEGMHRGPESRRRTPRRTDVSNLWYYSNSITTPTWNPVLGVLEGPCRPNTNSQRAIVEKTKITIGLVIKKET